MEMWWCQGRKSYRNVVVVVVVVVVVEINNRNVVVLGDKNL